MAFISGFSIMAIQMLGGRILAPWFGASIYIWGSIISTFLVALAIGYLTGGKLSLHSPSMRRYGLLFILAGVSLIPIILFTEPVVSMTFDITEDPRYGSLLAALMLFFIPATILGMISPYSIRLLVTSEQTSGFSAGILFFVSTLGSALGTIGTAFYFVLLFEINQIIMTTSVVLISLGLTSQLSSWKPYNETHIS
jgi:MFS family permease